MLRRTIHPLEVRSIFKQVVAGHEQSNGGRTEKRRSGEEAPDFSSVEKSDGIECKDCVGIFFTKDRSEEGDNCYAGYVDSGEGEDGVVFLESVV